MRPPARNLRPSAKWGCKVESKHEVPATVVGRATRGVGSGLALDSPRASPRVPIDGELDQETGIMAVAKRSALSVRPRHVLTVVAIGTGLAALGGCKHHRYGAMRPNFVGPAT